MRKYSTVILSVVALSLLVSSVWLVCLVWFKPFSILHFYERVYIEFLWDDPEALSQTGILEPFGLDGHEAELTSVSPSSTLRLAEVGRENLAILEKYDRESLSDDEAVSYDVLHWFLKTGVDGEPFLFHDYPVTHISGPHIEIPQFLSGAHPIESEDDIENYLSRLRHIDDKLGSLIDGLEKRRLAGVVVPSFILKKAILFCDHFIEIPIEENVLHSALDKKLSELKMLDATARQRYLDECQEVIGAEVYPAYKRLSRYLFQLESNSLSIAGVWQLPNGDAYYRHCLLQHTGVETDPEALYELGKTEMNRLKKELSELLHTVGHAASEDPTDILLSLAETKSLTFRTDEKGRGDCLSQFERTAELASAQLPKYFNRVPGVEFAVLEVPEFRADNSTFAFYISPRGIPLSAGKMYVNTWKADHLTHFLATTYAFHEGIPGHHLQKGIQAELKDLPTFRRFLPFTAYAEGWAMYAEQLGHEMVGTTTDPWSRIGLLQSDLFRTTRMLTDIGIHHKKWLRDQAVDFMTANTGMTREDVEVEVDRYIVWPGQGCAYKVGQLKFLELRQLAEKELGADFDIKEFHEVLIGQGAMPLQIMESRVKKYIEAKKK